MEVEERYVEVRRWRREVCGGEEVEERGMWR